MVLIRLAWKWQHWLIGLLLPLAIVAVDSAICRLRFTALNLRYWKKPGNTPKVSKNLNGALFKVVIPIVIPIVLLCIAITLNSTLNGNLNRVFAQPQPDVLIILIVTLYTLAVAVLCWHIFNEATTLCLAENMSKKMCITALESFPETVLLLDKNGTICQANPAT